MHLTAVEVEHRVSSADLVSALAARTPRIGGNDGGWPGLTLHRHTGAATPAWDEVRSLSLGVVAQGRTAVVVDGERHVHDTVHYLVLGGEPHLRAEVGEAGPGAPFLSLVLEIDPATVRKVSGGMVEHRTGVPGAPVGDGGRCAVSALDPDLMAAVLRLLRSLDDEADRRVLAPMCVEEVVYRVLRREQSSRVRHLAARQAAQDPVRAALAFVRAHYAEPLTVDDLARRAALSPSAFSTRFREATGRSPYQFLKQCRLDRARELLVEGGGTSVAAISRRVGYASASHFTKEFRSRFGVTPGAYAATLGIDAELSLRTD